MDLIEESGSDDNKLRVSEERVPPRNRSPRRCAVCGDSPAKIHYGVFACFGCKGFFRRAVKDGCNKYVCRYDRKCNVDKYERNSCRYCRFRRCLQVGMNPESVRPDRDQTGKQRIARLTKTQRKIISPILIPDGDSSNQFPIWNDWTKHLNVDLRKILMDLINLDVEIHKISRSVTIDAISGFSLRRLVAERAIQERKVSHSSNANQTSSIGVVDLSATSLWRLVEIIDWIEGVCRLAESQNERKVITIADKIAILQSCFSQQIIFTLSAKTAVNSTTSDIFCLYDCMAGGGDRSKKDLVDRILTEFVSPLRRLTPSDAELVILRAIITMNPDVLGLNDAAKEIIGEARDTFQELLFKSLKKSRPKMTFYSALFGNYLLLLPSFYALSECLRENLRCRYKSTTFSGCTQPDSYKLILNEVLNPFGTEFMDTAQIPTETCDAFDQESEHVNRLPNIVQTNTSPPYQGGLFATGINGNPSTHEGLVPSIRCQEASGTIAECDKSAFVRMQRIPQPPIPMIHSSALAVSAIQYGNCLSQNLGANCANSFSTTPTYLLPNASVAYPLINRADSPLKSVVSCPVEERPQTLACLPKLPLQFTKSMEEMLKPPGQSEDTMNWNRPLGSDWANDVKTPNKELVAQLFPDCADSI